MGFPTTTGTYTEITKNSSIFIFIGPKPPQITPANISTFVTKAEPVSPSINNLRKESRTGILGEILRCLELVKY